VRCVLTPHARSIAVALSRATSHTIVDPRCGCSFPSVTAQIELVRLVLATAAASIAAASSQPHPTVPHSPPLSQTDPFCGRSFAAVSAIDRDAPFRLVRLSVSPRPTLSFTLIPTPTLHTHTRTHAHLPNGPILRGVVCRYRRKSRRCRDFGSPRKLSLHSPPLAPAAAAMTASRTAHAKFLPSLAQAHLVRHSFCGCPTQAVCAVRRMKFGFHFILSCWSLTHAQPH
jgi:hypothetical protein